MFSSAGCSLLRTEGFSCTGSLGVLYGGLGISKLQFFNKKIYKNFSFLQSLVIKSLDPESRNPDPKHWWWYLGLPHCKGGPPDSDICQHNILLGLQFRAPEIRRIPFWNQFRKVTRERKASYRYCNIKIKNLGVKWLIEGGNININTAPRSLADSMWYTRKISFSDLDLHQRQNAGALRVQNGDTGRKWAGVGGGIYCRPVVAHSHHADEEQGQDPDRLQREKSDPDPIRIKVKSRIRISIEMKKRDTDPNQRDADPQHCPADINLLIQPFNKEFVVTWSKQHFTCIWKSING